MKTLALAAAVLFSPFSTKADSRGWLPGITELPTGLQAEACKQISARSQRDLGAPLMVKRCLQGARFSITANTQQVLDVEYSNHTLIRNRIYVCWLRFQRPLDRSAPTADCSLQ